MLADFFWFFLIDEVSSSFHYDHLLQKWHISIEATLVYVVFHVWEIVGYVLISHYELHRHLDL